MNDPSPDYRFTTHPTWDATARVYAATSVDPSVVIGPGSIIWRYTTILEGCVIGEDVMIADCCSLGRRVRVGDHSRIQAGCTIPDDMVIGAYVFIGTNCNFANCDVPMLRNRTQEVHEPPQIDAEAILGCGVNVRPGIRIGVGAVVAMGAVVTHDVPPGTTVAGNPARRMLRPKRQWPGMALASEERP